MGETVENSIRSILAKENATAADCAAVRRIVLYLIEDADKGDAQKRIRLAKNVTESLKGASVTKRELEIAFWRAERSAVITDPARS